jgi:hypothetical protein
MSDADQVRESGKAAVITEQIGVAPVCTYVGNGLQGSCRGKQGAMAATGCGAETGEKGIAPFAQVDGASMGRQALGNALHIRQEFGHADGAAVPPRNDAVTCIGSTEQWPDAHADIDHAGIQDGRHSASLTNARFPR